MDAVWKGLPEGSDPADSFYRRWSAQQFGEKASPKLVELYKEYFQAPAHFGDPVHEYGDQLYHTEARRMMLTYMIDSPLDAIPSQAPKWEVPRILGSGLPRAANRPVTKEWLREAVVREAQESGDAQTRWNDVWKNAFAIEPLIPADRQRFYRAQVLAMIAINRDSNRMLFLLSNAILDAEKGDKSKAQEEVDQAIAVVDEINRAEHDAEYGKWKNWYREDWLTGIDRTREMLQVFSKFLADPLTHIPPPALWDGWEAYYHILHYEGDRSAEVQ